MYLIGRLINPAFDQNIFDCYEFFEGYDEDMYKTRIAKFSKANVVSTFPLEVFYHAWAFRDTWTASRQATQLVEFLKESGAKGKELLIGVVSVEELEKLFHKQRETNSIIDHLRQMDERIRLIGQNP